MSERIETENAAELTERKPWTTPRIESLPLDLTEGSHPASSSVTDGAASLS